MLESAWLFVGLVALCVTAAAVLTSDNGVAMVAGALGFITWGVWFFGTLNVEVSDGTGGTTAYQMPSVALIGLAIGLIAGYIALTGPVELVSRVDDTRTDDI